ncbi:MAG: HD domain-containing protein [bacterium]|nr:HD domain-containing protein [bacterium]
MSTAFKDYLPLSIASITDETVLGFDLYQPGADFPKLYRSKNIPITATDLEKLREMGQEFLLVPQHQRFVMLDHLCESIPNVIADPAIPTEKKYEVLTETSVAMMANLYEDPTLPESAKFLIKHAHHHVSLALANSNAQNVMLTGTIEATPMIAHAIHVSNLSILLAMRCGITEAEELFEICLSGLLHEVGKVLIDSKIYEEGRSDRRVPHRRLKSYPKVGGDMMAKAKVIPAASLRAIVEHQERLDGTGFPGNLESDEISRSARIVSVCDFYDETIRFGEHNITPKPFSVLSHLKQAPDKFDERVVLELIHLFAESSQS